MNRLNRTKQAQVIAMLAEGNSISSIARMTGVSKVTILKLIKDAWHCRCRLSGPHPSQPEMPQNPS